ncbi:MAG: hypothetical protein GVY22_19075 [Gammaproteobacteria bacterium]|jgi:cyanophycin synthetase|nr:hypothetical protein [Gammaproteobacteria bacterium]
MAAESTRTPRLPLAQWGYRPGLRQPVCPIRLHLQLPTVAPAWPAVDRRLRAFFGDAADVDPPADAIGDNLDSAAAADALALAQRVLRVAACLQRAGGIPAFCPGSVGRLQADDRDRRTWTALVFVPFIGSLSARTSAQALRIAGHILQQFMAALTPIDRDASWQRLEEEVMAPWRRLSASGVSTLPVLRAAQDANIPWFHLGGDLYQLGWGAKGIGLRRSAVASDSALGTKIAQHKQHAADRLRLAGLPAPDHIMVPNEESALRAADQLGFPVVIKPANRDRGEGVTVDVTDAEQLKRAYQRAASCSTQVLVERQAPGYCHRLVVCRGQVVYAIERLPRSVVGDGRHSVSELIRQGNAARQKQPPWDRDKPYPDDAEAEQQLKAAGMTFNTVPAPGVRVMLRRIESTAEGGDPRGCTDGLHPENADLAVRAAALFGLTVAGVDLMTTDISRPWYETGAVINEVNPMPSLGSNAYSREHLPELLVRLMPAGARIPVAAIVGAESALARARELQAAHWKQGCACFLTSHAVTLAADGRPLVLACSGLMARAHALLLDPRVEALVLLIQTDELLDSGLPVDRLTAVEDAAGPLRSVSNAARALCVADRRNSLLQLLRQFEADIGKPAPAFSERCRGR